MECPLQEVDFRSSLGGCPVRGLHVLLGCLARKRENELGVVTGGFGDAEVGLERDCGTDGSWAARESETPEGFDLLCGQVADLLDIQVGAEWFDGASTSGDLPGGFLGGRCSLWWWRRVEGWRGALE